MKYRISHCLKKIDNLRIGFVYIITLFFLSSCGLKGPLYMPPQEDHNATNINIENKQKADGNVSIKEVDAKVEEKRK